MRKVLLLSLVALAACGSSSSSNHPDGGMTPDGSVGPDGPVTGGPDAAKPMPDAAPPDAWTCGGDAGASVCPTDFPICTSGVCTTCSGQTDCPVANPVCETSGQCAACSKENDCSARTDTPHCDTASGGCVGCRDATDCPSADAPVCDGTTHMCRGCADAATECTDAAKPMCAPTGACVECVISNDCDNAGAPICDNYACRPCLADSDCPWICDEPTGSCTIESQILFVDVNTATPGTSCTLANPCKSIQAALDLVTDTTFWVYVSPGLYSENLNLPAKSVHIVGYGATVTPPSQTSAAINCTVQANAIVEGLSLVAENGSANKGVDCTVSGSTLELDDVLVSNFGDLGVNISNATLLADRDLIAGNSGGGIQVSQSGYQITNTIVESNGTSASQVGGVLILLDPPSGKPSVLEFDTIADNQSAAAGEPSGVGCEALLKTVTFGDDIVWNNVGNTSEVSPSKCDWTHSIIEQSAVPGDATNQNVDPLLDVTYHLQNGSPAIDAAETTTGMTHDYDGDVRPLGTAPDIGADEHS